MPSFFPPFLIYNKKMGLKQKTMGLKQKMGLTSTISAGFHQNKKQWRWRRTERRRPPCGHRTTPGSSTLTSSAGRATSPTGPCLVVA